MHLALPFGLLVGLGMMLNDVTMPGAVVTAGALVAIAIYLR